MKFIRVPKPIQTVHPLTKAPLDLVTFANYALDVWLNDARMIGTPVKVGRLGKIVPPFVASASEDAADVFSLEDADYDTVMAIVRAPTAHYAPLVEMQLVAFSDAMLNAKGTEEEARAAAA